MISSALSRTLASLLVTALPALATPAADEPFRDVPIEDATALAEKEQRVLVLFFDNQENQETRRMVQETFADPQVRSWVHDHAVLLSIPPDDLKARRQHGVTRSPVTLFLNVVDGAGKLQHQMEGYRSATEFLVAANTVLLSRGEIQRPDGDATENPMAWLAWGNWLFNNDVTRADEALSAYLWCLDHGEEHLRGFRAMHLEFLLERVAYLKPHTGAAVQALWDRRKALKSLVLSREATDQDLADYLRFNYWLREELDAVEVFDQLYSMADPSARVMADKLMRAQLKLLTAWRRYEQILTLEADPLAHIDARLDVLDAEQAAAAAEGPGADPGQGEGQGEDQGAEPATGGAARAQVVDDAVDYFEALCATGRGGDGMKIFERVVESASNGRTYRAFIERTNRLELFQLTDRIGAQGLEQVKGKGRRLIELELRRAESLRKGDGKVIPEFSTTGPGRVPKPAKGGDKKKDDDGGDR